MSTWKTRPAQWGDLARICEIHNEGIADRTATLDQEPHTQEEKETWFTQLKPDEFVLVIEDASTIQGFAALTRYSPRKCYDGIALLSIYIARKVRGQGVGSTLLAELLRSAKERGLRKIILRTFPFNERGVALYEKMGFERVGIHKQHGFLDNNWVDVLVMEILI